MFGFNDRIDSLYNEDPFSIDIEICEIKYPIQLKDISPGKLGWDNSNLVSKGLISLLVDMTREGNENKQNNRLEMFVVKTASLFFSKFGVHDMFELSKYYWN